MHICVPTSQRIKEIEINIVTIFVIVYSLYLLFVSLVDQKEQHGGMLKIGRVLQQDGRGYKHKYQTWNIGLDSIMNCSDILELTKD